MLKKNWKMFHFPTFRATLFHECVLKIGGSAAKLPSWIIICSSEENWCKTSTKIWVSYSKKINQKSRIQTTTKFAGTKPTKFACQISWKWNSICKFYNEELISVLRKSENQIKEKIFSLEFIIKDSLLRPWCF